MRASKTEGVPDGTAVAYARSAGLHIAYRALGAGNLDVLMYPGAPLLPLESIDSEPSYARFLDRLCRFCRVIQFDGRGIGLSDPVHGELALDDWVQDGVAVLDAIGCERVVLLAGRDLALEAILMATMHPERVEKLILINGIARMRRATDYPAGIPDRVADRFLVTNIDPAAGDEPAVDFLSYVAPTAAHDPQFRAWWDEQGAKERAPRPLVRSWRSATELTSATCCRRSGCRRS
jgi:pimeloyl-ACP methyl ester carboxylesterase